MVNHGTRGDIRSLGGKLAHRVTFIAGHGMNHLRIVPPLNDAAHTKEADVILVNVQLVIILQITD